MGVQTLRGSVFFATAVAAAAVLIVPFVAGTQTLASSSTSASRGSTIVASSEASTSADKASETAGVADATVTQQPATLRSVTKQNTQGTQDSAGPRVANVGSGTAVRTAPGGTSTKICAANVSGSTASVSTPTSTNGVEGTTSADLAAFAATYNATRVANCLQPIPLANFKYDSCMQDRIFWMADDPSSNPASAWGHTSTAKRSDGLKIVGCDGDLDGGTGYTGSTVATDWWNSTDHRESLYQPSYTGSVADVCIGFAMTHGGYNATPPNEPITFVRAIAAWESC
jgi:hypothetical protein